MDGTETVGWLFKNAHSRVDRVGWSVICCYSSLLFSWMYLIALYFQYLMWTIEYLKNRYINKHLYYKNFKKQKKNSQERTYNSTKANWGKLSWCFWCHSGESYHTQWVQKNRYGNVNENCRHVTYNCGVLQSPRISSPIRKLFFSLVS